MDLMVQGFLGAYGAPEVNSSEDDHNQSPFGTWRPQDDGMNMNDNDRRRVRSKSKPRPRRDRLPGEGGRGVGRPNDAERRDDDNIKPRPRRNEKTRQNKMHNQALSDKEIDFKKKMDVMSKQMTSAKKEQREIFEAEKKELMKKIDHGRETNKALQKRVDELAFYRDLDSNDVTTMKEKVADCERKIKETEEKCELEKEDIRESFNTKMDILVKQLQKVQRRHDDLLQSSSTNVQAKENALKAMEQSHSKAVQEKEDEVATCKKRIEELLGRVSDEKDRIQETQKKHQQELFDLKEKHEKALDILRRRHTRELEQMQETHEKEIDTSRQITALEKDELHKKMEKIQTKLDLTQVTLYDTELKVKMLKTDNSDALKLKTEEIESLTTRLSATEKTVMNYRGRAKSEMDSIKNVVGKSKNGFEDRINQVAREKNNIHQELKETKSKLAQVEKQMEYTLDTQNRRSDALKKRDDELMIAKNEISETNKLHQKTVKEKDIQHIKDKKKWDLTQQKLREEISDLQNSLSSLNKDNNNSADLRGLVAQLKAEKSGISMKLVSLEEKANTRIASLEEQLQGSNTSPTSRRTDTKKFSPIDHSPSSHSVTGGRASEYKDISKSVRSLSRSPTRRVASVSSSEKDETSSLSRKKVNRSLSRKRQAIFDRKFSKD